MATFTIPNNLGEIRQDNIREEGMELFSTYNVDLTSNKGKILTSKKLERAWSASTDFDSSSTFADLLVWDGSYYALTEDNLYKKINLNAGAWSLISGGDSSVFSTMCVFDGQIRIVDTTDIRRSDGSTITDNWWTSTVSGTALTANVPHITATVQSQKETFYITDGSVVRYYEKGAASTQNVQLDAAVVACCLAPALDGSMWVGTFYENDSNAYVYQIYTNEQVGGTPVYRQAFPVDGSAVLAIWVKDNTPYIITEKGAVQAFNGVGFTTVNRFPFSFGTRTLAGISPGLIQDSNRARPIHPRGVKFVRDIAFININTNNATDAFAINSRTHSGVWTFDHTTNQLTHYLSYGAEATDIGAFSAEDSAPLLVLDSTDAEVLVAGSPVSAVTDAGLYLFSTDYATGMFTTSEITSDTVTEAFDALYHKATLYDDASIYTLYRTTKRDTIRWTANWTGAHTFTSTDDLSELAVGDLILVSHNYGSGNWSVVKDIQHSSTTYTVDVLHDIGLNGEASGIFSDNFKLIGFDENTLVYDAVNTFTSADGEIKKLGVDVTAGWIQYMVIMEGRIEYRQFIANGTAKNMI